MQKPPVTGNHSEACLAGSPRARNFPPWLALLILLGLCPVAFANVYNVTGTSDGAGTVTSTGGANFNATTLRAAVNAANTASGLNSINLPPGTYDLTLGELPVGTTVNTNLTINGQGTPANTIIQHNVASAVARVFDIDASLLGGVHVTILNVTIAHGRNNDGIGGAGIICGFQGPPAIDTTILSNCVLLDNLVITNTPTAVGGGVQNIGGTLQVLNCKFDSNSSSNFSGGAIYYDTHSPSAGTCQIANCTFTNNTSADPSSGGGALFLSAVSGSVLTVSNSVFTGNRVVSTTGSGGAIIKFGGAPCIVSGCTFTNNQVLGNSAIVNNSSGGAVDIAGGPMTIVYSRFVNNATAAATGHGNAVNVATASGASLIGDNNWWARNTGPNAADLSGASVPTWLKLTHYATPPAIPEAGSTTLTASFLTNSAGTPIPLANLGVLLGLPITFGNAHGGFVSGAQTTIQASATATATFTLSNTAGPYTADATVDAATATCTVGIVCPSITGNMSGSATICSGNSTNVTVTISGGLPPYSVTLNNGGGTHAGLSPLVFVVSPASTTTYSVSSATDLYGCAATVSGSATITVSPVSAVITPNPSQVCPGSTGNQASGPAGMSRYSWSISNGTITSATNTSAITYTAGVSGTVLLNLNTTNSSGCAASQTIGVPINPVPIPTISANPSSVNANSPGNQATGPAGMGGYAWTISNGTITGAANGQSINYVAGQFGTVTLNLVVTSTGGCSAGASLGVPILSLAPPAIGSSFRTSYFASITFPDALPATTIFMAFDGSNYWSCSGGTPSGLRLARYDTNGNVLGTYSPGLDFRSVFTDGAGVILARAYADPTIYRQYSPGVFVPSGVTLAGGSLDLNSAVMMNAAGTEYVALSNGVVSRWNPAGTFIGAVSLQGFGTLAGETNTPQNVKLSTFGNFWLTGNGLGIISVWDTTGIRLAQLNLRAAGTSADSQWSFSYCNGKVFIVDVAGGSWRGYDVGSPGRVIIYGAPGVAAWNNDVQAKIFGANQFLSVDAALVNPTFPVPPLSELRRYESALVYSDGGFNNNTNLGNNLADYEDLGGGVVVNTFAFWSSGALSMQGRLVTGNYLPFTTGSQTTSADSQLVKDQPTHPIFSGVSTFDGGSSSYHNSPISSAGGVAALGHWSLDGQPLVGVKDNGPGRTAGLNFYPPSGDANSGFWLPTTGGGRLMANALLYAGKVPPIIQVAPSNSVSGPGTLVSFNVSATGLPPLTYQWRKNATNISGATGSAFSFTSAPGSNGLYTVVVSNSYGFAVSAPASLNAQLRILPPALGAGKSLSLWIGASDGSPLAPDRAARIRLYGTTNLSLPLSSWTLLTYPIVFSNGLVRVDGINASTGAGFYRAAETP